MAPTWRAALPRRPLLTLLACLGLVAALARLPLIRNPVDVSPDGCEYLGIARHLLAQGRWISSLKWNFFTDAPVIHPALADRPPLYPLWAAGWMALSTDPDRQIWLARAGNLLLAAAVPPVLFWTLEPAVTPLAAALAAFIFTLYPAFIRNSAEPLTEPLFLLLLFGSLGRFLRADTAGAWFVTGLWAGLSFLTRPTGILLPVLYTGVLLASGGTHGMVRQPPAASSRLLRWRPLAMVMAGFVLPLIPYWIAVTVQTGSPFTSILRYNYSIRHIDEGTLTGFERTFESPAVFIWHHAGEVAHLIARQWGTMGRALGRSLLYLWPLALFWRRGAGWKPAVLLAFAGENFVFHAVSWTVWGAARYLFPTYIIGIALLADAPIRWAAGRREGATGGEGETGREGEGATRHPSQGAETARASKHEHEQAHEQEHGQSAAGPLSRPLALSPPHSVPRVLAAGALAAAMGLTLSACIQQDVRLYQEKSRPFAGVDLGWAYALAGRSVATLPPGTICAADQPWIVNLLGRQPAVMAPQFRDAAQLRRYLARYRPAVLILFVTEREPKAVDAASRLVIDLWTHPALRPDLADVLELRTAVLYAARPPRQALFIFRVRPAALAEE